MKKLLISLLLITVAGCLASEPLQITGLTITPISCTDLLADGEVAVTIAGGLPPYTVSLTGFPDQIGLDSGVTITYADIPAAAANNLTLTVRDNTAPPFTAVLTGTINTLISRFTSINLTGDFLCTGATLEYTVGIPSGTTITALLQGPTGFTPQRKTLPFGTFTNLIAGTYTLTLTPLPALVDPVCDTPTVITFEIEQSPLAITSISNLALSQGSNLGDLRVVFEAGVGNISAELTGPLPEANTFPGALDPLILNAFRFSNLPGGFFTLAITDSSDPACTVTQQVLVNFFASAVANRIALANC